MIGAILFVVGVALLGAAVSSPGSGGTTIAASNVSSGFDWLDSALAKLVDPTVPAIANHAKSSTTTTSSSTSSSTSSAPAGSGAAAPSSRKG